MEEPSKQGGALEAVRIKNNVADRLLQKKIQKFDKELQITILKIDNERLDAMEFLRNLRICGTNSMPEFEVIHRSLRENPPSALSHYLPPPLCAPNLPLLAPTAAKDGVKVPPLNIEESTGQEKQTPRPVEEDRTHSVRRQAMYTKETRQNDPTDQGDSDVKAHSVRRQAPKTKGGEQNVEKDEETLLLVHKKAPSMMPRMHSELNLSQLKSDSDRATRDLNRPRSTGRLTKKRLLPNINQNTSGSLSAKANRVAMKSPARDRLPPIGKVTEEGQDPDGNKYPPTETSARKKNPPKKSKKSLKQPSNENFDNHTVLSVNEIVMEEVVEKKRKRYKKKKPIDTRIKEFLDSIVKMNGPAAGKGFTLPLITETGATY